MMEPDSSVWVEVGSCSGATGADAPGEGGSYLHLCLETADLAATVAELRRRGVAIARDIVRGADGNLQAWIKDVDGNDIELMQIDPQSPQGRARAAWAGTAP